MPAEECNNGKWKWGETGECKYDSQEEAEKDNEDYYENNDDCSCDSNCKCKNNNEIEVEVEEKSMEMQLDKRHIISIYKKLRELCSKGKINKNFELSINNHPKKLKGVKAKDN